MMWSRVAKGMPKKVVLLVGLALLAAAGCDDTPYTDASLCHRGDTRECVGPGACKGAQECDDTGRGFQPCVCAGEITPGAGGSEAGMANEAGTGNDNTTGGVMTTPGGAPGVGGASQAGGAGGDGGASGAGEPQYECTPIGNVGCSATQNCSVGLGEPQCVGAGSKTRFQTCGLTSECAPGLTCIFRNCVEACKKTADCATLDEPLKCGLGYKDPYIGPISGCFRDCDVVNQNCPVGQACYLGSCVTPLAARGQGEACDSSPYCAKGLDCLADLDGDSAPNCSKYCSTTVPNPCGQGLTCYGLDADLAGLPASWGLCIVDG